MTESTNATTTAENQQQTQSQQESKAWSPPASQADFDRIISDRLARERQKFADYDEMKEKASQYDAAQEAAKTEQQKQADALAAAEAKVAEFERRDQITAWAKEVEETTGVSASVLRGSSKEELEAHAAELKALGIGQRPTAEELEEQRKLALNPPVSSLGQMPSNANQSFTIDQQIAAAEQAGNADLVGTLKAMKLGGS